MKSAAGQPLLARFLQDHTWPAPSELHRSPLRRSHGNHSSDTTMSAVGMSATAATAKKPAEPLQPSRRQTSISRVCCAKRWGIGRTCAAPPPHLGKRFHRSPRHHQILQIRNELLRVLKTKRLGKSRYLGKSWVCIIERSVRFLENSLHVTDEILQRWFPMLIRSVDVCLALHQCVNDRCVLARALATRNVKTRLLRGMREDIGTGTCCQQSCHQCLRSTVHSVPQRCAPCKIGRVDVCFTIKQEHCHRHSVSRGPSRRCNKPERRDTCP
mmetsp:Transcript_46360/g.122402  ORF Transcript_46360/g.122402 Transcript_46360/m.122402 type:complete len:270 (-) Transcript_46360:1334-2143(-)